MSYILVIDNFGRKKLTEVSCITGINASKLESKVAADFIQTGSIMSPEIIYPYRVQGNITLTTIDYRLYVLDAAQSTLKLPSNTELIERGTVVNFANTTKANFIIDGNGVKIVRSATKYDTVTLAEMQTLRLVYLNIGEDNNPIWIEI